MKLWDYLGLSANGLAILSAFGIILLCGQTAIDAMHARQYWCGTPMMFDRDIINVYIPALLGVPVFAIWGAERLRQVTFLARGLLLYALIVWGAALYYVNR